MTKKIADVFNWLDRNSFILSPVLLTSRTWAPLKEGCNIGFARIIDARIVAQGKPYNKLKAGSVLHSNCP